MKSTLHCSKPSLTGAHSSVGNGQAALFAPIEDRGKHVRLPADSPFAPHYSESSATWDALAFDASTNLYLGPSQYSDSTVIQRARRKKDRFRERGRKHNRKEGRRQKHENALLAESLPSPRELDEDLGVETKVQDIELEEDSDLDENESVDLTPGVELPVSSEVVATEFSEALKAKGLTPHLSGGSAIHFQGGLRPLGDFDFRVTAEEAGFSSFNEPKGLALLDYLNDVVIPESREEHKKEILDFKKRNKSESRNPGIAAQTFHSLGGSGLTIGNNSWFGAEISLSLVFFDPGNELVSITTESGGTLEALSLEDLLSDKLKSMITRRKSGQESVQKVAKDLFDFVNIIALLNKKKAESVEDDESPDPLSIDEHLENAVSGKIGEYSYVNHDQRPWHDTDETFIKELMKARAVMTAMVYQKKGPRAEALTALIDKYAEESDLKEPIEEILDDLYQVPVPKEQGKALAPWFKEWNKAPNFAPPQPFKRLNPPVLHNRDLEPPDDSSKHADELIYELPDEFLDDQVESLPKDQQKILKLLAWCDGFRELPATYSSEDTQKAFGLAKNKFNTAWRKLRELHLVEPVEGEGLLLTTEGRTFLGIS